MTTGLEDSEVQEAARALREAERTRTGIEPLTAAHPELGIAGAYRIQTVNIDRRLDSGERIVGRKIGLTSEAMQRQLGVDQPDFGALTDAMVIPDGSTIQRGDYLQPKLEPEFAFRLSSPVGLAPSLEEVRDAVGEVAVALELIDSRITDWRIRLADTIADNASCGGIVTGPWEEATPELLDALPATVIDLRHDGESQASGPGSAVLGDPLKAIKWLATALAGVGAGLEAGDVVLAGSVCAAVPITDDDAAGTWAAEAPGFRPATVVVHSQPAGTGAENQTQEESR